jgi:hypothetical protein
VLAYLDPGSGSYFFQLAIAGFLGFLFTLRQPFARAKDFFRRLLGKKKRNSSG